MQHRGTIATSLLEGLNEPQREAVEHADGPLLILAGPGSGKTRVVTRRAAYLARTITSADRILALTFTNKAAREMRGRIAELGFARGMTVSTFHALCARLLREYAEQAGVPPNYTIFDRDDRRKLIKAAIEESSLSTENWPPASVEQAIGRAKNAMLSPANLRDEGDFRSRTHGRIYEVYESLLAKCGGLDFDDLLVRMANLLRDRADVRKALEDRFQYVLVDEYQDTNGSQYMIARALTATRNNLCATGDPDQSIYGWRGADLANILQFEKDFPSAHVVRLEQNYRSTGRILAAADALISNNCARKEKTLWTDNPPGKHIDIIECETGDEEAQFVVEAIAAHVRTGGQLSDVSVFYRVNSLSRVVEEALIAQGIRYQVARGTEFYNRCEIKDVLAYLRALINPKDDLALQRIINTPPRGIGGTTVKRLREGADRAGVSLYDYIVHGVDDGLLGRSAGRVRQFVSLLTELSGAMERPAPEALELIISQSGLRAHHGRNADVDDAPLNNLNELVSAASSFMEDRPDTTILDWLEHTALLADVDSVDSAKNGGGMVTLMTLHAAKGLEFPVVFIVGVEEGLIPFRRQGDSESDKEEERRLLFVGMTRAQKCLTLLRARYRMLRGRTERTIQSPFLDELPSDAVEWHMASIPAPGHSRQVAPRGRLPEDIGEWSVGTVVRHPTHGLGQILSLDRGTKRSHVNVHFEDGTHRAWVLEFADLRRVDFDELGDFCPSEGV